MISEPKLKVFLEILLELSEAGANFTDDDLRDEVIAIIIAVNILLLNYGNAVNNLRFYSLY